MNKPKIILGIETSCDETSAAVVQKSGERVQILSNIIASSADLQAKYGGVIPEQAAREQLSSIIPVIKESLQVAGCDKWDIDAIAVTEGPGLIGSLLVGVETAKTLSLVWRKPLIPVNHLLGHFYANWIVQNQESSSKNQALKPLILNSSSLIPPRFPAIGLLVSGGHTDLILMTGHGKYQYLGGTRDDAAGEAFDKTARILGLPYPGGPQIAKLAETGNPKAFKLPRPMLEKGDFSAKGGPSYGWDFSFSGLKTAVANLIHTSGVSSGSPEVKSDLAASIQEAIVDVLVAKTVQAAKAHEVRQIMLAGGVAANRKLAERLIEVSRLKMPHVEIHIPPVGLCTDNAAYIASAAFFNYHPVDPLALQANPNLTLSH